MPNYETVSISGSQHQPNFCMKVIVKWNGKMLEELGKGRTKKAAGNCAAERMLQRLNGRSPSPIEFPADHTTGAGKHTRVVKCTALMYLRGTIVN